MIISPHTFELFLYPKERVTFKRLLETAHDNAKYSHPIFTETHKVYNRYYGVDIDEALKSSGFTVRYHKDSSTPSIRIQVNPSKMLGDDDIPQLWKVTERNLDRLISELRAHIDDYFNSEYKLNDFILTRIDLTANIDVGSREKVTNYIEVLRRIGRVYGFQPKFKRNNPKIDKFRSFDLVNRSAGVEFSAYDKEGQLLDKKKIDWSGVEKAKGILRVEVRLKKYAAFSEETPSKLIKEVTRNSRVLFMKGFQLIVPRGDYYKKGEAVKLIVENIPTVVHDLKPRVVMLQKMIDLIELIPKHRSLYIAKNKLNYRDFDVLLDAFAMLNVSPVTIGKGMDFDYLHSLYRYLEG